MPLQKKLAKAFTILGLASESTKLKLGRTRNIQYAIRLQVIVKGIHSLIPRRHVNIFQYIFHTGFSSAA